MYDAFTDLLLSAMGGNIHLGLWRPGEADDLSAPTRPAVDDRALRARVERATDRMTDLVAELLALTAGQRLLDVGCGSGRPAERIAALRHVSVTGITVSARQAEMAWARGRLPGAGELHFRLADATAPLPFPPGHFDAAYAIESLIHIADAAVALRHIAAVLRPGGRIVIADACLRAQVPHDRHEIVERVCELFKFAPLPTMARYEAAAAKAGLRIADVAELDDAVRPSYGVTAAAVRAAASLLDGEHADELRDVAELLEEFGAMPELGYAALVLTRP